MKGDIYKITDLCHTLQWSNIDEWMQNG